jgi:hypothetical protein
METNLKRIKRYNNAIRDILLKEWDPIGVKDVPEAQDEYDSYIPGVCKLLINRESSENIFQYLWKIETDNMGLTGNRNHTKSIAKKLAEIER